MARFLAPRADARKIAAADSVAVLGLGRFGTSLALELMAAGTHVLGVDQHEANVQVLNGELTQVVKADITRPEVIEQLSISEFDRVVVAIGNDLQASILTCSLMLSLGIPNIWAKAQDDRHGLILKQLGVHHIVYPEKDMGRRVAHLVRGAIMDYLEVDKGYAMVKMTAPAFLHGVPLGETRIRSSHGVTIAAHASAAGAWQNADAATVLSPGDRILVLGPSARAEAFGQLH